MHLPKVPRRCSLPDKDLSQADLVSCAYKYTSDGKLLLESKQDMRKRGVPSSESRCCASPSPTAPHSRAARISIAI